MYAKYFMVTFYTCNQIQFFYLGIYCTVVLVIKYDIENFMSILSVDVRMDKIVVLIFNVVEKHLMN